ncbi:MAG: glycosyltransferase [Gammaproteobacteria bacterium]|nr:glycosyltransferase [Gammaproteobacteria bacterium]
MGATLSIIIPAYNESKHIENLLVSIRECFEGFSLDYETIVVNNGSTDATKAIALKYQCTVLDIERSSISYARNYGVLHSSGKVIAFIDADVRLTKIWVKECLKKLNTIEHESIVLGARYIVRENPSWIEINWFKPLSTKIVDYINGGNLVLSRVMFEKIGGFDQTLETGEDYEFSMRAKAKGINVIVNKKLKAIHDGYPSTIKAFFKREAWHGKGDFSSFMAFKASNVAKIALLFGCLHIFLLMSLLFLSNIYVILVISLIITLTIMMSARIFHSYGLGFIVRNIPICYIYLLGRSYSLVAVLLTR